MIQQSRIFEVYQEKRRLYTKNLTPGKTVYDESLVKENNVEYREWNPRKSKLASLILKGCTDIKMRKDDIVLYLGSASGTTVSHISDILGKEGFVFALDFAPRVVRDLVFVCEDRKNIAPILADANKPETYSGRISQADIIYQDIAQKNQLDIFIKNISLFLKKGGFALLAVKARSIDVTKSPKEMFIKVRKQLEQQQDLIIVDYKTLEPFQLDHCMFVCKRK